MTEFEGRLKTEAELIADVDERTDQTRRSWASTVGNALLLLAFLAVPRLSGVSTVFVDFDVADAVLLALPALACVLVGAVLYRLVGPRHRAYLAIDACELCALHAFPSFFPLVAEGTVYIAGGFLVVSATFWAQGKPGRARLYAPLVTAMAALPVVVLLFNGRPQRAALAGLFGAASVLAYLMTIRIRLGVVRAEVRRNRLRESERALKLGRERQRIEQALTHHLGGQLEALADDLDRAKLSDALTVRRMSEAVSELVFPTAHPVPAADLVELVLDRCRSLCAGARLVHRVSLNERLQLTAHSARAVLRMAQELVRNALIHGRASTVDVLIEVASGRLSLTVSDDGVGLPEAAFHAPGGGLHNVRAWLDEAGGTIALHARAGFSTSICVTLGH